ILQHHFESNDAEESNVLINSITRLSDKVEDISLVNLLLMVTPNSAPAGLDEFAIKVLDTYTMGRYQESINLCRSILESKSYYTEFALIYVKSLIELDLP